MIDLAVAVQNNSSVTDLCSGTRSGTVNGETEVMGGFGEILGR